MLSGSCLNCQGRAEAVGASRRAADPSRRLVREDPADGIAGPVGHDQGPDDHEGTEAQEQQELVADVLLEGPVGDREEEPNDQADDDDRQHGPGHPAPALAHGVASPPPAVAVCALSVVLQQNLPEIVTARVTLRAFNALLEV
jgi:hypothetical protein